MGVVMRVLFFILLIAVVAGAVAWWRHCTAAPKEEGIARLKLESAIPYIYNNRVPCQYYPTNSQKTDSLIELPADTSEETLFFKLNLPDSEIAGCFSPNGKNRYRLYLDTNGNNQLSDEQPFISFRKFPYRFKEPQYAVFGPISINNKDTQYYAPFYLFFTNHVSYIHIAPTTVRTGQIKLGDAVYDAALGDLDYDSRYATLFSQERMYNRGYLCDEISFTISDNTSALGFNTVANTPFSELLYLNQRYYSVTIPPDGSSLSMMPTTPEMGLFSVNSEKCSLYLYSNACSNSLLDITGATQVPAGDYLVYFAYITTKDDQGIRWAYRTKGRNNQVAAFEVVAGQTTQINFNPTFTLVPSIDLKNGDCSIDLNMFDQNGISFFPGFEKNDGNTRTWGKPVLTILAENGDTLHTGSMEYG
jgi:hypothetical protein